MTQEVKFCYVQDGKLYLKSFLDYPEREIGEVTETEEATIAHFEERFKLFEQKVEELLKTISETENKGSYLMKILHLKEELGTYKGVGDFEAIYHKLDDVEKDLQKNIEQNRERNLMQKEVLLAELNQLLEMEETPERFELVKELQKRWVRVGRVTVEKEEEIEGNFKELIDGYFASRKTQDSAKKELFEARVSKYQDLLTKAEELLAKGNHLADVNIFKELQSDWKEVGAVPRQELGDLWTKFRGVADEFFSTYKKKLKEKRSNRPSAEEALKKKQELCEEAEKLMGLIPAEAVKQAKQLQQEWKNAGFVAKEHIAQVQTRFNLLCDAVFEWEFAERMTRSKVSGFDKKSEEDRKEALVKTIRNLISRDNEEVSRYAENISKLTITQKGGGAQDLFGNRLGFQQRKLEAKKFLLKYFRGE